VSEPGLGAPPRPSGDLAPPDGAGDPGPSAVYLHPGQMHVATGPCAIKTLLGSCVAVCIWEPDARVGGAVHYLLPRGRHGRHETGRYGTLAIPALVQAVCALGGQPGALHAKIFGGARVLAGLGPASGASLRSWPPREFPWPARTWVVIADAGCCSTSRMAPRGCGG